FGSDVTSTHLLGAYVGCSRYPCGTAISSRQYIPGVRLARVTEPLGSLVVSWMLKLGSEAKVTLKVALASGTPDGSDFVTCSSPEGGRLVAEGVGVGPEGVADGLGEGCAWAVSTSTTSGAAAVAAFVSAPRRGRRAGAVCGSCVSRLQRNVVQAFATLEPRQP